MLIGQQVLERFDDINTIFGKTQKKEKKK